MLPERDGFKPYPGTTSDAPPNGIIENSVMATKLFVGNINHTATENDLQDFFAAAGTVVAVNIIQDRFTGKSRGFGFVEMSTEEEANNAIARSIKKNFKAGP